MKRGKIKEKKASPVPEKPREPQRAPAPRTEEPPRVEPPNGSSPIGRDADRWKKIDRKFRDSFGEPLTLSQEEARIKKGIEHGIRVSKLKSGAPQYSFFHCESLLAEAKLLLENGLPLREQWRALGTEEFHLKQEIDEFRRLDEIHQREIADGYYAQIFDRVQYQQNAEWSTYFHQTMAATALNTAEQGTLSTQYLSKYEHYLDHAAYISQVPVSYEEFEKTWKSYSRSTAHGNFTGYKPDIAFQLNWPISAVQRNLIELGLKTQTGAVNAVAQSSHMRSEGLRKELAWLKKDVQHRKDRTKTARDLMDLKMLEATRSNGALNYPERRDAIRLRFMRDFEVAVILASVGGVGLRTLYGIDVALPSPIDVSFYDKLLNWVTDRLHDLARIQRKEQSYAAVVPAVPAATVRAKRTGKTSAAGVWSARKWKLDVKQARFDKQYAVRLRGVSAHVRGDTQGMWQLRITPPRYAFIRTSASSSIKVINQTAVPSVYLGRVRQRDVPREPDVVGLSSLRNVSPIGEWSIEVSAASSAGEAEAAITGIEVDLHLAFVAS